MKKLIAMLLTLALAASLSLTVFAAEHAAEEVPEVPSIIRVWGKVSSWDGKSLFLKNGDENDHLNEVVVHLGDAPVIDAVTGLSMDRDNIKTGDVFYAWIGPAMTMSLPPQTNAIVAVGNVPADMSVPQYYEVTSHPVDDPENKAVVKAGTTDGELVLSKDADVSPWMTRQMVTLDDLTPGTQILVWKNADGIAEKVVVFAYAYEAYLCTTASDDGSVWAMVNGEFDSELDKDLPRFSCLKTDDGVIMVPVRAVAEAAGYDVHWDRELGAIVSLNGEKVLSVKPGETTVRMPDGDADIGALCVLENGVTYLPAADLSMWLNVFYRGR